MRVSSSILALTLTLVAQTSRADQLIGVEPEGAPADEPADAIDAEAPATTLPKTTKSSGRATAQAPDSGDMTFSGSIMPGKTELGGQATVGYALSRWFGVDATYTYLQIDGNHDDGVQYGPEVDGVLRAPNPTIVTPFVGVGPGYIKWQRTHDDEVFDAGSTMTMNVFGGINIRMTSHFGLQLQRRRTTYVQNVPKSYADLSTREERTRVGTNIGFYMAF